MNNMESAHNSLDATKIKEEPDIDFCHSTGEWVASISCDKLKLEILEPDEDKERLTCTICDVIFVNDYELKIHSMIHSLDHTCFICNEFIKNKNQFVGHVRRHMCAKPFQCPSCERAFPSAREMKLHQRVHSDDRPFMCTECGKAFKQIATLKDHEVVHTGEKRFKCKICEGAFATATSLRRHIRVMHETLRSFKCHFCYENFTSKQALKQHTTLHKDEHPFTCKLCGEIMESPEELAIHRNNHVEMKGSGYCQYCGNKTFYFGLKDHIEKMHRPRTCEICNLVFYDDKSMENHRKYHLEEQVKEEFRCSVCGKQFEFPRYLKAHMKRHEEDYKKFKCELCEKTFSSKRDLTDHLNVHADVKNYACNICHKAFRTKQSVNKHMPIHSDKRPYKCSICDKSFKKQSILRKHSFTHSRDRPFCCELCNKSYKSKESLRVHRLSHQRDKYKCNFCKQSFKFNSLFKNHECFRWKLELNWVRCNFCKKVCKNYVTHAYHVIGHSKGCLFQCKICGGREKYLYRLELHKIKHRNEKKLSS